MIDWTIEIPKIDAAAGRKHVDPAFVQAIRETENGSPGREFGVLSETAPTYEEQLRICVTTVAHRLSSFPTNPFTRSPSGRLIYNHQFIAYFAGIWAPYNANNDPTDLNRNWYNNCCSFYARAINSEHPQQVA